MKTKLRLINLALSTLIVASMWFFLPTARNVDAFGIPTCGLMQGSRLADEATNNTICVDPECNPPQTKNFKKCLPAIGHECLLEGAESVQCNQNCQVLILKQDRMCQCVPPALGCPPGMEYNVAQCTCVPEEPSEEGDPDECEECDRPSPILISVRGNRLELTDWSNGVEFDLDADGFPEQLSWTHGGSGDAFLVLDRNGNGTIDDGTELFGNFTPQPPSSQPNGFVALAVYDQPESGGNEDGWISAQDTVFNELELWIDSNHDGISQTGEMSRVDSSGIEGINLDYHESRRTDRHGNSFRYTSLVRMARGSAPPIRFAVDVFFVGQP